MLLMRMKSYIYPCTCIDHALTLTRHGKLKYWSVNAQLELCGILIYIFVFCLEVAVVSYFAEVLVIKYFMYCELTMRNNLPVFTCVLYHRCTTSVVY